MTLFRASSVWFQKGVRDIPGSLLSATSSMPSGKSLMYFGLLLASGVFFIFIAFTMFLPVMVLMPQKFAICFILGCGFIIGSAHMTSMEFQSIQVGKYGEKSQFHLLRRSRPTLLHLLRSSSSQDSSCMMDDYVWI